MPGPSSATEMTTVEPAARAETRTVARPVRPAARRSSGGLAAVVDRVGDQVLEASATPSSTRVSSSTSSPSRTSTTSLPVAADDLAHELGEGGNDPARGHHRQAHRAVADAGEPVLGVLDAAAQLAGRRGQLVAERDEPGDGVGDVGGQAVATDGGVAHASWPSRRARPPAAATTAT